MYTALMNVPDNRKLTKQTVGRLIACDAIHVHTAMITCTKSIGLLALVGVTRYALVQKWRSSDVVLGVDHLR